MGGTWTSQNKIRPGAYINFTAVGLPATPVGDRGIGTLAVPLNWGAADTLIDVYSTDLMDGASLAKVGVTAFDEGAKLLNLMLSNCYLAKVFRLDTGGTKATQTSGGLTVTARYPGTLGNTITITIAPLNDIYRVTTWVNAVEQDRQDVSTIDELVTNAFVEFTGEGELVENAGITLEGGTNGTITPASAYPAYLALAHKARWQTMALTQNGAEFNKQFATFADQMRNDEGKYVQVVLAGYDGADSVSVINTDCGVEVGATTITAEEATAWVAGITAGAAVNQSNVGRVFPGATKLLVDRTNSEIIAALESGTFILSTNQRGDIIVEDDINSLHTFTPTYSRDMRLNQVVRVMDEVGTSATDMWEQSFKGKTQNNENGRGAYRSVLLSYFGDLQALDAIENYTAEDVTVSAGEGKESVLVQVNIQPVAAMSKLYMVVRVI